MQTETFLSSFLVPQVKMHTPHLALLGERRKHRPDDLVRVGLGRLGLKVQIEQLADASHRQLVVVVVERGERVLQHVARVRQQDQRQHPLVDALRVVHPLGQYGVLDLSG